MGLFDRFRREPQSRIFNAGNGDAPLMSGVRRGGSVRPSNRVAAKAAETYPILQTSAGVQTLKLTASTLAHLPVRVLNSQGTEVDKPPVWVTRPGGPNFPEVDFGRVIKHIVSSLLLDGVAYVGVNRSKDYNSDALPGEANGLVMIDPRSVEEIVDPRTRRRKFVITGSGLDTHLFGGRSGALQLARELNGVGRQFGIDDMLIWTDGVCVPGYHFSLSPFDLIRDTLGTAIQTQRYGHRHFQNYADRPTLLTIKESLLGNEEEQEQFKRDFIDEFTGEERGAPKVLTTRQSPAQDIQMLQVGDTPREIQITDIQQYAQSQIAMASSTPLALIGGAQAGGSAYNSLQIQKSHWAATVITPLAELIGSGFARLLPERYELRLDTAQLGQGDHNTMAQIARNLAQIGIYKINEARELMGLDPIPEGDQILVDGNRVTIDYALAKTEPAPPPGPAQPAGPDDDDTDEPEPDGDDDADPPAESQPTSPEPEGRPPGS